MKLYRHLFIAFLLCTIGTSLEAQVLRRIGDRVKSTAENRAVDEAGEATEKALDEVEEGLQGNGDEQEQSNDNQATSSTEKQNASTSPKEIEKASDKNPVTVASYKNYDFVPGDKIIFYYDMAGETDAEIPGRMLVNDGSIEIQTHGNEKVLFVPINGNVSMRPLMENESYLPEQFTLEFDVLATAANDIPSTISLYFRTSADAERSWDGTSRYYIALDNILGNGGIDFTMNRDESSAGGHRQFPPAAISAKQDAWRRVAIYVNKNIGKVYLDQHRIAIVNQIKAGAGMVTFEIQNQSDPVLIKNIRIAAGGSDAYNKVVTSGKFIAYGIQFDVNKATLKPESMGTINEIAKMLKDNTSMKFEIGGHTDSDGSADLNNKLSQSRAETVKQQLVSMGIDAARLSTKGYGSTQPIADNSTPENKAKNRRVEFVKK
jgi:outer membrane protein OmpA-like peptidoglycan-associated protein